MRSSQTRNFIDGAQQEGSQLDSVTLDEFRLRLTPDAEKHPHVGALGGLLRRRGRETSQQHDETRRTIVAQSGEEVILPQLTAMIGEVFEPLKPLREKLSQLTTTLESIDRVRQLADALGPIHAFKDKLASAVDPILNLEQEIEQLAGLFEPMRVFRDQLANIKEALGLKLSELMRTLEPLSRLRDNLSTLADTLEPATKLHDDFAALAALINTAPAGPRPRAIER